MTNNEYEFLLNWNIGILFTNSDLKRRLLMNFSKSWEFCSLRWYKSYVLSVKIEAWLQCGQGLN